MDLPEGPPQPTEPSAAPLLAGRFRLLEPLGAGGMATVYRSWDERLQVHRAVKILAPRLAASPSLLRRFESEARTMARLHHPHIVTVHDVGHDEQDGRVYLVMELIDGGSLADRLQATGPLRPEEAARMVADILAGLDVAHSAGVVHRDIKPANVMIGVGGRARIGDFGIARMMGENLTRTGTTMGTLAYMAPEMKSDAKRAGPAADIYAAGATLYALLTGEEPFDLYIDEVRRQKLSKVPSALSAVIEEATRYRPEDRYRSAAEMRGALLAAADRPDHATPTPAGNATFILEGGDSRESAHDEESAPTAVPIDAGPTSPALIVHHPRTFALRALVVFVGLLAVGGFGFGLVALAMAIAIGLGLPPGEPAPIPLPSEAHAEEPAPEPPAVEEGPDAAAPEPTPAAPAPREAPRERPREAPRELREPETQPETPAPRVEPPAPQPEAPVPLVEVFYNARPERAEVWLDGDKAGDTPYHGSWPAGAHRVEIRSGGRVLWSDAIELSPGEPARYCHDTATGRPCSL